MTLLSRITGLARESLKAIAFGAGVQMDAFEAAFRLPNILRRLFAEGAFSQAFVPILAEYHRQRGDDATRDLVGRVGALLAVVLLGVRARRARRAVARLPARRRLRAARPGKVELTAHADPHHVPVHPVRVAGVARGRRAQRLPAVRDSGVHAGAAQPVDHRRGDVPRAVLRSADHGARVGRVRSAASRSSRCRSAAGAARHAAAARASTGATRACGACCARWGRRCIGVSAAQISALINTQLAA